MYSEATLIRKIRERFGNAAVEVAVGDDAAVVPLPHGFSAVLCSDLLAENTHFRRESHPPESIGHKAIAVNVSDIGAMGAIPGHCLVSLAVPRDIEDEWIDGFLDGVAKACRRFEVELVGGDSSTAERIVVDVAMMGRVETGRSIQRCGARVDDGIFVTGHLGGSALGLEVLGTDRPAYDAVQRHLYPEPRHGIGRQVAARATAMIDTSDGLSVDLSHILTESRVSARIDPKAIPCFPGARFELALHGGEDYELIVTGPDLPSKIDGVPITRIGTIVDGQSGRIVLVDGSSESVLDPAGWQHFGG